MVVDVRTKVETPCLLVNHAALRKNIEEMAEYARSKGIKLRPHQKTHKTAEIARMQIAAGAEGVTCAKLGEAEALVDAGVTDDVFFGYQIVGPEKIERLLALMDRARVRVAIDSLAVAEPLSQACSAAGKTLDFVIEINTGLDRAGVLPGEETLELAKQLISLPGLNFLGIMTHEGHVAKAPDAETLSKVAQKAGQDMVDTAELLRSNGIPVEVVSVGSTPGSFETTKINGITEMRPGTYVFYDNASFHYDRIGPDRCALTIVATVISRPAPDRAVVDSGSKTLAMDPAPAKRKGHGYVVEIPDAVIVRVSEEHGVIELPEHARDLAVGDVVHIIPNHVCPTVNLQDELFVLCDDGSIERWPTIARGKVR